MSAKSKKEAIKSPRGMHDILPADIGYYNTIVEKAREIADYYGFSEIKTPHVEYAELFIRPLGETSDVVQKEMYTFRTKGGDLLALRPEETVAIMRAYAEHGMTSWPQPVKLFYEGAYFRHENPQRGRFREFHQFGAEILNDAESISDAIIIKIFFLFLSELGFKNTIVHINSMGDKECKFAYRKELTGYYRKKFNYLCKNCKRRFKENPMRILDCKEISCLEFRMQAPQMIDYFCDGCKSHFRGVLEFLDESGIPYYLNNHLARGFDYYGRTVFEIFDNTPNANSAQDDAGTLPLALAGGGRYDDLMALLGQKPLPATGGAAGIERIIFEMKKLGIMQKRFAKTRVFLIQIGPAAKKKSFVLMDKFRKEGIHVDASLSRDNLKNQLNIASKIGAQFAVIIGQKEAMENSVIIRDMDESVQETISESKLIDKLKTKLKVKK